MPPGPFPKSTTQQQSLHPHADFVCFSRLRLFRSPDLVPCTHAPAYATMRSMERVPEETREPEFRLFHDKTSLEDVRTYAAKQPKRDAKIQIADAILEVFEIIGGVPRMALVADQHPLEFLKIVSRLAPKDIYAHHSGEVRIIAALPPSALDDIPGEYTECVSSTASAAHPTPLELLPPPLKLEPSKPREPEFLKSTRRSRRSEGVPGKE